MKLIQSSAKGLGVATKSVIQFFSPENLTKMGGDIKSTTIKVGTGIKDVSIKVVTPVIAVSRATVEVVREEAVDAFESFKEGMKGKN